MEGQRRSDFSLVSSTALHRKCHLLGPSTAVNRSFLERCALTTKAAGDICRNLSKPPERSQGPSPRPIWLQVGSPSALVHMLAYSFGRA